MAGEGAGTSTAATGAVAAAGALAEALAFVCADFDLAVDPAVAAVARWGDGAHRANAVSAIRPLATKIFLRMAAYSPAGISAGEPSAGRSIFNPGLGNAFLALVLVEGFAS